MAATDMEYDEKTKASRMKNCCKKVLKFLFSHIGLCGMVVAYSVAGGFIFEHLELLNERTECIKASEKYLDTENKTMQKIYSISEQYDKEADQKEKTKEQYEIVLQKFRNNVIELGYDGKDCNKMGEKGGPSPKWSYAGALLFSVTVITTIGKFYWVNHL